MLNTPGMKGLQMLGLAVKNPEIVLISGAAGSWSFRLARKAFINFQSTSASNLDRDRESGIIKKSCVISQRKSIEVRLDKAP